VTPAEIVALDDVRAKADLLHALACAAEREGRMDAAIALAAWADSLAPYDATRGGR
jgi:hypothetical protein